MRTVIISVGEPAFGDDVRLRVSEANLAIVLDALIERCIGKGEIGITEPPTVVPEDGTYSQWRLE